MLEIEINVSGRFMKKVWLQMRPYGRLLKALYGFWYDFMRYYAFSGWRSNFSGAEVRNYHVVKIYHSLEKSMSFKKRNSSSGWKDAAALLELIKCAKKYDNINYHDRAAVQMLRKFIELDGNKENLLSGLISKELSGLKVESQEEHGSKVHTLHDFQKGCLELPEDFFFSRYSLREFRNEKVCENVIRRAVSLAMKTPSVCNRQAWHVYHTANSHVIEAALKYQAGNRGFGEKIPNLFIITADLKGFMAGEEHYQHWIDGGLFSMSLIYGLHSLGVATCCLNWSQTPSNDKRLRKLIDIQANHTVIMMLAIGWPDDENKVCVSARRPLDEVYTSLTLAE